ncbi:hypothetical protein GLYMA_09G227951v4 [Glycine max]|nr:hypothetical protein GLYMA_09G227951v4 [Glycine max]KAH1044341.1 hypothetical protein GYH30_025893 [Glycine max]
MIVVIQTLLLIMEKAMQLTGHVCKYTLRGSPYFQNIILLKFSCVTGRKGKDKFSHQDRHNIFHLLIQCKL